MQFFSGFAKLSVCMQDGSLSPFKKSEPIPEVNDEPVKVVVADSVDDVVFKSGKNGQLITSISFSKGILFLLLFH